MQSLLVFYLIVWEELGYLVAFLGTIFEGDAVWFTFSFLSSLGFFNLFLMILAVFLGSLVGDLLFYFLGTKMKTLTPRLKEKLGRLQSIDNHIKTKPFRTLFISKFVYGIHRALLVRYGMLDISLWELLKADFAAISAWMLVVGSLGYFVGLSFYVFKEYFKYAEIGLLIGLVLFYLVFKFISKKARKEI